MSAMHDVIVRIAHLSFFLLSQPPTSMAFQRGFILLRRA